MSAAAGPAAAAAAAVPAKRAEADKADEVRQRLKLMRMQQLQLRHLNARMEAALHAKKEKVCNLGDLSACMPGSLRDHALRSASVQCIRMPAMYDRLAGAFG
jgi:hypothetical protein